MLGCVVSFGLKNDVVLIALLLLDVSCLVCVFFVLWAGLVECQWCNFVGLVLWWKI